MSCISHMHFLSYYVVCYVLSYSAIQEKPSPEGASKELFNTTAPLSDKQNTGSVLVTNGEELTYWMLEKKH